MTRRLVLTNEGAGHPFRRSLPPPSLKIDSVREPLGDGALFTLAFTATFVAAMTFIA